MHNTISIQTINFDQKQRINLSARSFDVLQLDKAAYDDTGSRTGFLNELLRRCTPVSEASIDSAVTQYRRHLEDVTEKSLRKNEAESAILRKGLDSIVKDYEKSLTERALSWPSGESLLFRLSNDNCVAFYGDSFRNEPLYPLPACYSGKVSRYLKAILEDYSSHIMYERESLYFHEEISLIQMAAESGKMIRVSSARPAQDGQRTSHVLWDVRVYDILPDDSGLYHYVVGMVAPAAGTKQEEHVASLRLSRIRSVRILDTSSARSGRLTASEKKHIEKRINENRVQFLASDREDIIVKLNQAGKNMFSRVLYMRPRIDFIDEEGNYHFSCSRMQAEYYFQKFGGNADILSPKELRESFALYYQAAHALYGTPES